MSPTLSIIIYGLIIVISVALVLSILKLKIAGAVAIGIIISDVVIGFIHRIIIEDGVYVPHEGDTTLFIYWICSIIYFILLSIVYSIKYRSKGCICCRRPDYMSLEENDIWDKLV